MRSPTLGPESNMRGTGLVRIIDEMVVRRLLWRCLQVFTVLLATNSLMTSQSADKKELTVFAASSLAEAFRALGKAFEIAHAPLKVEMNFAGSQQLAQQIANGAAADVFAPASMKH